MHLQSHEAYSYVGVSPTGDVFSSGNEGSTGQLKVHVYTLLLNYVRYSSSIVPQSEWIHLVFGDGYVICILLLLLCSSSYPLPLLLFSFSHFLMTCSACIPRDLDPRAAAHEFHVRESARQIMLRIVGNNPKVCSASALMYRSRA